MSRSIVRSKINAKYNPVQTGGGGGGSAIAVYDEATLLTTNATSFTFTGLGIDATASGGAVTVTVNNNEVIEVKNATASSIPKGSVCYINILGGSGTHPEILLASAATESTSSKTIGVTADAIASGAIGFLIINGEITGTGAAPLDTSAYNAGAMLWLSNTPGQWTSTIPPFPSHAVFIGHVTRSQTVNGRVVIKIQNGYEVQELHDTQITTKLNGQFLMVDTLTYAPNVAWVNKQLLTKLTVSQITTLRNNSELIPGVTYQITNAPIGSLTSGFFYVRALDVNILDTCGVLEYQYNLTPLRYKSINCWYDLDTNTHIKLIDPNNRNTIEGWTNIQNFLTLCAGNLLDTNYSDNIIINDSILTISTTSLSIFNHNYISNSIVDLTNFTGSNINSNHIEDSGIYLNSSNIGGISNNIIKNSSINTYTGAINLSNFIKNNIEFSTIDFYDPIIHFTNFSYNRIKYSNISINNSDISDISYNDIHKSIITANGCTFNSLSNNVINVTTLTVAGGILANSQNISNNEINDSNLEINNCELNYCNINGMGLGSSAYFNTNTSYNYCNYRLLEDSTFYVTYDIDDPFYYNAVFSTLNIPNGHEPWVGKILLTSSLGAGIVLLKTISNPSVTHKYSIYIDGSITRLDIDIVSGFFIFPLTIISPFKMSTPYDFAYFDGRYTPIGVSTAGESVMIGYDNY